MNYYSTIVSHSFRIACLGSVLVATTSLAQDTQVSGVQVLSIGSGEGMSEALRERLSSGASFSFAAPSSSISLGGIGGVNPNDRSQLFNLLSNESVRRELQLTDEQYGGAKKIMQESQERVQKSIQAQMSARQEGTALRIGGPEFRNMMQENQQAAEAAIEEILLPEQLERIRQLAYQVEVSQTGLGEALVSGRLGKEIDVHEDQKQHLTDRAAKIEEEARQAIIEIRAKARAKLFAELAPEQRKEAEELLGPYFEYKELSLGQQIRKSISQIQASRAEPEEE